MKKLLLASILLIVTIINCPGQGTWTTYKNVVPGNIMSIHFSDEVHGFITCTNNKIYRTSNGGVDWNDVSPTFNASSGCWYSGIYCLDSNTAIAGTHCDDFIVRTTDAGVTWDSIQIVFQPLKIYFIPKTKIGFVISNSDLFSTTDGGLNWTKKNNTLLFISQSMLFISDSIGFLGGRGDRIYKTKDQGSTWDEINTGMSDGTNAMYFFNSQHGIIVDGDGNWAITYDQGLTWSNYSNSNDGNQVGVYFVNNNEGYKVMSNSLDVKYSSDGGVTWKIVNNTNGNGKSGMSFPSKCVGYVADLSGDILKYYNPNCKLVGIDNSLELNTDIVLFPNPASNTITIESAAGNINIYDMLGKKINSYTKENSNLNINIQTLNNGVYFLKLTTNEREQKTIKFIVNQ